MTSSLRTYTHHGLTLRSTQNLQGWKLDLAVAVYHHIRGQPCTPFTADLVKVDALFPGEESGIARRDRINRLYDRPVQVEGLVFRIESGEKSAMYQKTRRLVAQAGSLDGMAAAPAHQPAYQPALYVPAAAPAAAMPYAPPQASASVTAELRAWKGEILALLLSYGVDPRQPGEFMASEDRIRKLKLRMSLFDHNLDRLATAVREKFPDFVFEPLFGLDTPNGPADIEPLEDLT